MTRSPINCLPASESDQSDLGCVSQARVSRDTQTHGLLQVTNIPQAELRSMSLEARGQSQLDQVFYQNGKHHLTRTPIDSQISLKQCPFHPSLWSDTC